MSYCSFLDGFIRFARILFVFFASQYDTSSFSCDLCIRGELMFPNVSMHFLYTFLLFVHIFSTISVYFLIFLNDM